MVKIEKMEVIDLSPSPPSKDPLTPANQGTPLRPVFVLKDRKNFNMREIEEREDCFILDFDPCDALDLSKLTVTEALDEPEISIVAERGEVACRDYPHSRHLCLKNPFEATPHETFCEMCYCFVCDKPAPCKTWSGFDGHCHAIDNEAWKLQRKTAMGQLNRA